MSNHRMSLDIAVGLAHLSSRALVLSDLSPMAAFMPEDMQIRYRGDGSIPTIIDLFDVPVEIVDEPNFSKRQVGLSGWTCPWNFAPVSMFYYPEHVDTSSEDFAAFRNNRRFAYTFSDWEEEIDVLRIDARLLCMYSYYFYVSDELRSGLTETMRAIRPKAAYQQYADELAASIGEFNAVHIRRGDFKCEPHPERVTGERIAANLKRCIVHDVPLVICTDRDRNDPIFKPILGNFGEVVFIDYLMQENKYWRNKLRQLPFFDDSTLALITQLVACRAIKFIGTLFSTYSALIQRMRGLEGVDRTLRFATYTSEPVGPVFRNCEFIERGTGPYSWNRLPYPASAEMFSWFREWPEAFTK